MKLNKILSSALAAILLVSSLIAFLPQNVNAAYVSDKEELATLDQKSIEKYVQAIYASDQGKESEYEGYKKYEFQTAEEMFLYEASLGYLKGVDSQNGKYAMFINIYTGLLYYMNKETCQILTSNPWYYSSKNTDDIDKSLLSQIIIDFSMITTGQNQIYYSSQWAAERAQIKTEYINNGIRVNYVLGDTTERYLLPEAIRADKFEELIYLPMLRQLRSLMEEYCPIDGYTDEYDFENEEYKELIFDENGNIPEIRKYVQAMEKIFKNYKVDGESLETYDRLAYRTLNTLCKDITQMTVYYNFRAEDDKNNPYSDYGSVYIFVKQNKREASSHFRKYCGSYSISEMLSDEKELGVEVDEAAKPVFNCSIEYSFNEDGSLSVRLPANSISFDETLYTLNSVTVLPYFGAGELSSDNSGYVFYPDGSGAIIKINDFLNEQPRVSASVYGADYCYSNVTGAHREQITMPVFGIVTDTKANASITAKYGLQKVTNGYFAIIEEGASLANIEYKMGGASYKFAHAYCSYTPYPSDKYDLSETISVGGATSYTIVSESKYNGSYVTRYVMLDDENINSQGNVSSYMGMVNYYRNYLYNISGTLTALETVTDDLPLYLEVLGAMDVVKKILSFPVSSSVSLTSFEDIATIYDELSSAKEIYEAEALKYEQMANEAEDENQKLQYKQAAEDCRNLAVDIKNINFRLNGFANGGLYSTYPTKVKWSRACGGKSGFEKLLEKSSNVSSNDGSNLGIYPDFDFSYINNTKMFDGISKKGNVSRMVDNRYASKQTYNSVLQEYETAYSLVINPKALDDLYSKFISKYSKYDVTGISVSTLGSDLNSNFDEDEPVNRDEAEKYITNILSQIKDEKYYDVVIDTDVFVLKYENSYNIMVDKGNVFTLKYAKHILNANIDSSHLTYSSYTIPFVGMVLHGSLNYTGKPINYSGTTAYDILRCIESGASLYYILAYNTENIGYMKEDEILNKYYGVDYATWHDSILKTYKELNDAIGDLQTYKIVDHEIIKGERVIEASEWNENYRLLINEFIEKLEVSMAESVDDAYKSLAGTAPGTPLKVSIDKVDILKWFASEINAIYDDASGKIIFTEGTEDQWPLLEKLFNELVVKYESEYDGGEGEIIVNIDSDTIAYESDHRFVTVSEADAADYDITNYTSDIDNIVIVTYENGTRFILNYNIYTVDVRIDGVVYEIEKYGYVKLEGGNQ